MAIKQTKPVAAQTSKSPTFISEIADTVRLGKLADGKAMLAFESLRASPVGGEYKADRVTLAVMHLDARNALALAQGIVDLYRPPETGAAAPRRAPKKAQT